MGRIKRYYSAFSRYHKSGGFGIHSPFAFYFVTRVLRERSAFYAYEYIKALRHSLIKDLSGVMRHPRIISYKNAKLIFRVTNYFNPTDILQIGSNYGISMASVLSVSSKSHVYLYDVDHSRYAASQNVITKYQDRLTKHELVEEAIGDYSQIVKEKEAVPFVMINGVEVDDYDKVSEYLDSVFQTGAVVIMRNLANSDVMKRLWHECKSKATFGMTFSNEKIAFLVINPKLQREDFLLWF